jgi:hypothetical protein
VQAQAQRQADIQPGAIGQLQEAHIGRQRAHGFFGLQQRRFFHAVDLVQHHHVGAFQLLAEQLAVASRTASPLAKASSSSSGVSTTASVASSTKCGASSGDCSTSITALGKARPEVSIST